MRKSERPGFLFVVVVGLLNRAVTVGKQRWASAKHESLVIWLSIYRSRLLPLTSCVVSMCARASELLRPPISTLRLTPHSSLEVAKLKKLSVNCVNWSNIDLIDVIYYCSRAIFVLLV